MQNLQVSVPCYVAEAVLLQKAKMTQRTNTAVLYAGRAIFLFSQLVSDHLVLPSARTPSWLMCCPLPKERQALFCLIALENIVHCGKGAIVAKARKLLFSPLHSSPLSVSLLPSFLPLPPFPSPSFFLEIGSYCATQTSLEHLILLPQCAKCWNYR